MSFKEIKGQGEAVRRLESSITNNRIAPSYIFTGPKGSGRFLLAVNFAKALNCYERENFPCDACFSCKKIDSGAHPDVRVITSETKGGEIKIQKIREIGSEIILKPYEGRYKVFIIKDAHLMNNEASNAFLKTLEEPPANSVLILITEKPSNLMPTIASRCQVVRVRPLGAEYLAGLLVSEYGMEKTKAESLARICEGSLGKFKEGKDEILTRRDGVLERFSDEEFLDDLSGGERGELSDELSVLAGWYRDILVFKATQDTGLIINCDRLDDIRDAGKACSIDGLLEAFGSILKAREEIKNNVNPKLALSAMLGRELICTK